jgi:uncharacterized protein
MPKVFFVDAVTLNNLLFIGAIAGVLAGMFGLGGGVIIVPALILLEGFTQTQANGTSLAVLVLPVGIFGCIEYYRKGKLDIIVSLVVGAGIAIGSYLGAGIALGLPKNILSISYGIFLLYMGWRYLSPIEWYRQSQGQLPPPEDPIPVDLRSRRTLILCAVIGFFAGISAGLFGIGGGVIIVVALTIFLGFDQKLATGTSLGALLLPSGLPGAYRYYLAGDVDLQSVLPIIITLAIGALIGARVTLGLPTQTVKRLFGIFALTMAIRFIFFN